MIRPDRETLGDWIRLVNDEGRKLTEWERSFMESVTDAYDRGIRLSDRQVEILENIYTEKTL